MFLTAIPTVLAAYIVLLGMCCKAVGVTLCVLIHGRAFFSGEVDKTFVKNQDQK